MGFEDNHPLSIGFYRRLVNDYLHYTATIAFCQDAWYNEHRFLKSAFSVFRHARGIPVGRSENRKGEEKMYTVRFHRLGSHQDEYDIEPTGLVRDIFKGLKFIDRTVIDFGIMQKGGGIEPGEETYHAPDISLFEDGNPITKVLATHVHLDHFGFIPALTQYFAPTAKVYMTRPSEAMAWPIWEQGIMINSKRGTPPPYNYDQFMDAVDRISVIEQPGMFGVIPGLPEYVEPKGHIHGACGYSIKINGTWFHVSGDQCSHDQPGVNGAPLLERKDDGCPHIIAGSDCTYGADPDSDKRTYRNEMDRGYDIIARTVENGHPVLAFCFGVHRSGALAHEMQRRGLTDIAPVFLDGQGRDFTERMLKPEGKWCGLDQELEVERVLFVENQRHRDSVVRSGKGYFVISTPGMGGPGGTGTFWRRSILRDPGAAVLFMGYVAPETDGAKILRAARVRDDCGEASVTFMVHDRDSGETVQETIPLRCQVVQIRIGSHDSRGKILEWFRSFPRLQAAMLNHGSKHALDSLGSELASEIPVLYRADRDRTIEFNI